MDTFQEVEQLAETVRRYGNNPAGISALDEILVKCRAYMEHDQSLPCDWLNTTPSRRLMFNLLLRRRGQAVSRESLLDVCNSLWDSEPQSKLVDAHICHLRHALMGTPYENMIETVWGRGYRLRTEAEGPIEVIPLRGRTNGAKYYRARIAA